MLIAGVAFTAVIYGMLRTLAAEVGASVERIATVLAEVMVEVLSTLFAVAWLLDVWRQAQDWLGGG